MDRLLYLYIFTGMFGIGVILVDLFTNAISSFQGDGEDGGDGDGEDADDARLSDIIDISDVDSPDAGSTQEIQGSYMVDYRRHKYSTVLKFIGFLRTLVYFSAGFGIIGTFALLTGESRLSSLLWSVPVGLITVLIFKLFKRIQNRKLDSSFSEKELLHLTGEALLPIEGDAMGKVKINFGSVTLERYAKLAFKNAPVQKGDAIVISQVDSDVVYVQKQSIR
jgi:membrane protein implicated in regulation of membrane protease activity